VERVVAYPKFEQAILTLQWHKGFLGMRRGFDEKMMKQIEDLSSQGFELKAALNQNDPTWFTLFFQRQVE
jgi:hypothetical protein